jgi:hypothetical protein
MRFKEFLAEKAEECKDDTEKFKDVDCSNFDDLTEEEQEWCKKKDMMDMLYKSRAANG